MITATLTTRYGKVVIRHTTGWQDEPGPVYIDTRDCVDKDDAQQAQEDVRRWLRTAIGMWGHSAGSADSIYQFNLYAVLTDNRNPYMQAWAPEVKVVGREDLGPQWDLPPGVVG